MTDVLPPALVARIKAATDQIKTAPDPLAKAAAVAEGQDIYDRAGALLRLRLAEGAILTAHSTPIRTKGRER